MSDKHFSASVLSKGFRLFFLCGTVFHVTVVSSVIKDHSKYAGFKVFRVQPLTASHADVLRDFQSGKHQKVEIWKRSSVLDSEAPDDEVDILVSPEFMDELLYLLEMLDIPHEEIVPDVMEAIRNHEEQNRNGNQPTEFRLDKYHSYQQITEWMDKMQLDYPDVLTKFHLGNTWHGKPIFGMKISSPNSTKKKPSIWMDGAIHSNEWIAPATLIFFIHQFATALDPELSQILDQMDLYIVPVLNVDGYLLTWDEDRLWRKSRSVHVATNDSNCEGVDMNRNWDFYWQEHEGSSLDPCSRLYAGPHAFSEPEIQAVRDFLQENRDSVKAYLAYHSFSQLWMMPYAYSRTPRPDNYQDLLNVSQRIVAAIEDVHGTHYTYGRVSQLIGLTSGSSVDYIHDHFQIKYTFGVELRDNGIFGTLLPPNQIIPNSEESLAGLIELARWLIAH